LKTGRLSITPEADRLSAFGEKEHRNAVNFLQNNPFFRLLLPFITGIVLTRHIHLSDAVAVGFVTLAAVFISASFLLQKSRHYYSFRYLFGVGIFILSAVGGYKLTENRNATNDRFDFLSQKGIFRIELTGAPVEKANSYQCEISLRQHFDSLHCENATGNAIVYFQKDSASAKLLYGDLLIVEAVFDKPDGVLNPYGFDYAAYLKRQGIGATAYIAADKWMQTGSSTTFSLRRTADKCRNHLLNIYRQFGIEGQEFAVLAALTLGYTDSLDRETRDIYSGSGAMHVLAVSGLHVGIVYAVFMLLFGRLRRNSLQRQIRTLLAVLFLWAYAFIAGLSPSVIRATTMFTFMAAGTALNRRPQTYNTLFLSAFVMLLVNPNYLFEIGFQLSYSAVLSIVLTMKLFGKKLQDKDRWLWRLLLVSFAAQAGTAPFTVYYFNQFPVYFLLTNTVVIPAASVIVYSAVLLLAASFLPLLSSVIATMLIRFIRIVNTTLDIIHRLPFSQWHIAIEESQVVLLFTAVACFIGYCTTKKYLPLLFCCTAVFTSCLIDLFVHYRTITTSQVIVYAGIKHTHVGFIAGKSNMVYSGDLSELNRITKTFRLRKMHDKPHTVSQNDGYDNGFVRFKSNTFLVLTNDSLTGKTASEALEIDYLIVGEKATPTADDLFTLLTPKHVIVDKTITNRHHNSIEKTCLEQSIAFHSIRKQGAYILSFTD
jgi:competence protein ComEC